MQRGLSFLQERSLKMNLQEAIKCLRQGKMVKLPQWDDTDVVLIMLKGKIYELSYVEKKALINEACLFSGDILSDQWQVAKGY
jgi:hypothetical protein